MAIIKVSNSNFEEEVLNSDKRVVVDFWADWCGPCKMLGPVIDELSEELTDIKFCKVNVDEEEELAVKYKIMSIPSVLIFEGGKLIDTSMGFKPKAALAEFIK